MKRTAIYVRVSTDSQKDGDSVPAQREALRKYIEDRPESQGGAWILAQRMKITKIL